MNFWFFKVRMAQFISWLFRRWVWFCTNGAICWLGKMRFGVSTVFFTISCWCYFENFRRITYYCFLEKPRLQLQHRFRCAGMAQGIMMQKNKWFYFMMPLIGNEAVGCATLSSQLQPASRAMLQIVLGVHWPQCLQNIEALGSWGDTQTQCQIFSYMCFLRPWSVSVTLSLFSRSKANGDGWGGAYSPNFAVEVSENFDIACNEIWCQTFNDTSSHPGDHTYLCRGFLENVLFFLCLYDSYEHQWWLDVQRTVTYAINIQDERWSFFHLSYIICCNSCADLFQVPSG